MTNSYNLSKWDRSERGLRHNINAVVQVSLLKQCNDSLAFALRHPVTNTFHSFSTQLESVLKRQYYKSIEKQKDKYEYGFISRQNEVSK